MSTSPASVTVRLTDAATSTAAIVGTRPVETLTDEDLLALLTAATDLRNAVDVLVATGTAEVARRSVRDLGYRGLAQRRGHRNVTSLVQNITGQSRSDVFRTLRVGEELLSADPTVPAGVDGIPADREAPIRTSTWLDMLRAALAEGRVGLAQFQAIRTGLGDPPVERYPDLDPDFLPDAWARAVDRLLREAGDLPVEELRAAARIARDRLDPIGVTVRFEERFTARSFRTWTDEHGQRHGRFVFDDDAAAWVDTILNAALRPRRGPRFVSAGDSSPASDDPGSALTSAVDERSNEQLQYDTLIAVLRTGAKADPSQAFGDRQPGVRVVVEATAVADVDHRGRMSVTGIGHYEDGGAAVPRGVVETYLCDAGATTVTIDALGRPLDVGREQRLFTRKQRIVIAVRDGGCMWPSCTAPPSWCEYHHNDHWWEDHGRTDVDDGVPLCRNCHLRLHNQGWRITRRRDADTGVDTYWLHPPPDSDTGRLGEPVLLETKSPRRFEAA